MLKSNLYIFSFFFVCPFGVLSKKLFLNSWSLSFYIMFFSKSFIVLTLTFKSMIHFELIFTYSLKFNLTLCMWIQLSQHYLLKGLPFLLFSDWIIWVPCWKPVAHKKYGFISGLNPYASTTHSFDFCCFVMSFETGDCESSNVLILF